MTLRRPGSGGDPVATSEGLALAHAEEPGEVDFGSLPAVYREPSPLLLPEQDRLDGQGGVLGLPPDPLELPLVLEAVYYRGDACVTLEEAPPNQVAGLVWLPVA